MIHLLSQGLTTTRGLVWPVLILMTPKPVVKIPGLCRVVVKDPRMTLPPLSLEGMVFGWKNVIRGTKLIILFVLHVVVSVMTGCLFTLHIR